MFQSFVQQMYKKERLEQTFITVKTKENLNFFRLLLFTHSTHKQRLLLMLVLLGVINASTPNKKLQSDKKNTMV